MNIVDGIKHAISYLEPLSIRVDFELSKGGVRTNKVSSDKYETFISDCESGKYPEIQWIEFIITI